MLRVVPSTVAAVDVATGELVELDEAWWCTVADGASLVVSTDDLPARLTTPIDRAPSADVFAGPLEASLWRRYRLTGAGARVPQHRRRSPERR